VKMVINVRIYKIRGISETPSVFQEEFCFLARDFRLLLNNNDQHFPWTPTSIYTIGNGLQFVCVYESLENFQREFPPKEILGGGGGSPQLKFPVIKSLAGRTGARHRPHTGVSDMTRAVFTK
jgi:hypothetical protein